MKAKHARREFEFIAGLVAAAFASWACGSTNEAAPVGQASGGARASGRSGAAGRIGAGAVAGSSAGQGVGGTGAVAGGGAQPSAGGMAGSAFGSGGGNAGGGNRGGRGAGGASAGAAAVGGAASGGTAQSGGAVGSGGLASAGQGGAGAAGSAGGPANGGSAGATDDSQSTIVPDPSWTCGMADGIPPPTQGELVFQATFQLGPTQKFGITQYGQRRVLDLKSGTATGTRLQGTFLAGGFDFELTLSNGAIELEQIDVLKTSDGTLIYMRNCGVAPAGASEVRIVPDFEVATSSSLAWLNSGKFAGTRVVDATAGTMQLSVYDVANVAPAEPKIQLMDPAGEAQQPWDCSTATGGKGASVFTENVTLGSSLSIGASKRGTRNIIPITGGTISGKVTGTVVSGGGDYQLLGSTTKLDARYVLTSSDGEFVLVRNCGPLGSLVPLFETRADGPYAFLNANNFVSSDPGSGSGGVSITFYERK